MNVPTPVQRALGRARAWLRDESILALDLYIREGPNAPRSSTEELSRVLRAFPIEAQLAADPSFRSEASVRTKLANFRALDPGTPGGLTHGSSLDRAVWDEFAADPERLASLARTIRSAVASGETTEMESPEPDFAEAPEGAILTRLHRVRERSRKLVERKKAQARQRDDGLYCETCGFSFSSRYGALGDDFIECHHLTPVSELRANAVTRLSDLALVCANCHRMLHRRRPWLTLDELRALIGGTP